MKISKNIHHEEAILKAVNRFCITLTSFASFYSLLYIIFGEYSLSLLSFSVGVLFYIYYYINKKSSPVYIRVLIILTTSVLVTLFSIILGFNSGIYMYLFAAPHLIYLFFHFRDKKAITLSLGAFLLSFIVMIIANYFQIPPLTALDAEFINMIFPINIAFSMVMCVLLIRYFASNNASSLTSLKEEIEEKNRSQENLIRSLKEKEILLSEIHHRVKNNLATISGLMELQRIYVRDPTTSAILKESYNRIKSIALLHEKLYENKNLDRIDIQFYVNGLIEFHKISLSKKNKNIQMHIDIDPIEINIDEAQPFALLLNELITNSFNHAFDDKNEGNIYIRMKRNNNEIQFEFRDDGIGYLMEGAGTEKTLGLNLIEAFSNHLKGEMKFHSKPGEGVYFLLNFKIRSL